IGPDKRIKLILVYPMTTGRNFDEVLRVLDSLQLTAKHKVATPVNWEPGEDVIIAGSVSDEEAKKAYPKGWKAPRPYMRIVPQPDREDLTKLFERGAAGAAPRTISGNEKFKAILSGGSSRRSITGGPLVATKMVGQQINEASYFRR